MSENITPRVLTVEHPAAFRKVPASAIPNADTE
jgi:hypothetical protein